MKDDYGLDATYSYDDDEEWGDDEAAWNAEEEPEEEPTDAKDESSAYLEFLNEEVSCLRPGNIESVTIDTSQRPKSSVILRSKNPTMRDLERIVFCSSPLWTSSSHIRFSARV